MTDIKIENYFFVVFLLYSLLYVLQGSSDILQFGLLFAEFDHDGVQ